MDIRNCPRCGKVFAQMAAKICPNCEAEEEVGFQRVKEYIAENPLSTLADIVKATEVSAKRIEKYIRDGRLEISKGTEGSVTCESCGKHISRGKYCDSCLIKITRDVDEMFEKAKDGKGGPKMHSHQKKL